MEQIYLYMVQVLAENSTSSATTKKEEVKRDRNSTEDDPRSGCSKPSTSYEQVDSIHCMILYYWCLTVNKMAQPIGNNFG